MMTVRLAICEVVETIVPSNVEDHPYREFERAGWQRAASSYAGSFEIITRLFAKQLLEAVGVGPGVKLLDVASGSGYLAAVAAESGAQVEAVDFSPNMVDAANARYPSLSFRVADAEALPFARDTFDAVVIGFGVHHFPFPLRALAEAHRVLRAGGRLGFTVWAPIEEHMIQKVVVDAVRETGNPAAVLPTAPAGAICDIETCLRLLRDSGFSAPPHAEKLTAQAPIESARQLIQLLTDGTVRMSSVIRSLPQDKKALLAKAVERSIDCFREGDGYKIPAAAILAVGTKA
jgi:SAM-dependent methyltransferase